MQRLVSYMDKTIRKIRGNILPTIIDFHLNQYFIQISSRLVQLNNLDYVMPLEENYLFMKSLNFMNYLLFLIDVLEDYFFYIHQSIL